MNQVSALLRSYYLLEITSAPFLFSFQQSSHTTLERFYIAARRSKNTVTYTKEQRKMFSEKALAIHSIKNGKDPAKYRMSGFSTQASLLKKAIEAGLFPESQFRELTFSIGVACEYCFQPMILTDEEGWTPFTS